MRMILQRLRALLRRNRMERELNEEIGIHLAMQEEEFRHEGMDAASAHAAALRQFGGVAQSKEDYRDRRGLPWLESAARDLRYGLRGMRRTPGFTLAAVLSLALGIGANTAIFSLFHTLMLRLLPVERPQELVSLYRTGGWIESRWGTSDANRKAKFYELTRAGRKQIAQESEDWERTVALMQRFLRPAE